MNFMDHDRFIVLVTRKLAGEITTKEQTELELILGEAEYHNKYKWLEQFWAQKEHDTRPDTERSLEKLMRSIGEQEGHPAEYSLTARIAAKRPRHYAAGRMVLLTGCLVAVLAVIYFFTGRAGFPATNASLAKATGIDPAAAVVVKQNTKGTRSFITLADGTKVWLNADSRLKYPAAFSGTTREVELIGEAFFDVSKNKHKPFIIHLENGTVRVLGTSFNIKAYQNSKLIETSVLTGRVAFIPTGQLRGKNKMDTTFLTHDMKAVYVFKTGELKTSNTSSEQDKAWTEGKLIFNGASFQEIAESLERSFGKEVVFNNDEIMKYHLTGSFENNSLEQILYYLSRTKPFTYSITDTQIIISPVE